MLFENVDNVTNVDNVNNTDKVDNIKSVINVKNAGSADNETVIFVDSEVILQPQFAESLTN